MALSMSDILNGVKDFSAKTQGDIKQFIANADMIMTLAGNDQRLIVLTVIKTRLTAAGKLDDISDLQWTDIKERIKTKYKSDISFETAQERLLSIAQGPKEALDAYASRVKSLLDALNSASADKNAAVQTARAAMNEDLAIRKFKQNIYDERIRIMALSMEHSSLYNAVTHATQKLEQLNSFNIQVGVKSEQ